MVRQILSCFGGKMNFYNKKWDGYEIQFGHNENDVRFFPLVSLIPYFWDNEIVFDLGVNTPKGQKIDEVWKYSWELRDLDEKVIKQGDNVKQGDSDIHITNKGFRRKLKRWNSGKTRAIVLGTLYPHKEYKLYVNFQNSKGLTSGLILMATLTVEDRTSYEMQLFLVMFAVFMSLIIGFVARSCGVSSP
jgi:hypothetical protein